MDRKTPPRLIGLGPLSEAYNPYLHYSRNPTGSVVWTSSDAAIARPSRRLRCQKLIDRQRHFMSNAALTEGANKPRSSRIALKVQHRHHPLRLWAIDDEPSRACGYQRRYPAIANINPSLHMDRAGAGRMDEWQARISEILSPD